MLQKARDEIRNLPLLNVVRRTWTETSMLKFGLLFIALPALLAAIETLPQTVQDSLTLHIESPTLWGAYLSNFVHGGTSHLVANIANYVLLMAVLLSLAIYADWKRELYLTTIFFLTVLPLIVSAYSVWTLQGSGVVRTYGFSGIDAAFLGLLPVATFAFLRREVSSNIRLHHSLVLVAVEMALILFGWGGLSISVIGLSVLAILGTGLLYWDTRGEWGTLTDTPEYQTLLFIAIAFFLILPFQNLVNVETGTNVYGHLIGFVVGFLFPSVLSLVIDLRRQATEIQEEFAFTL